MPLTADGQLDLTDLDQLLDGAKVFSFTAMSNVLGTITPVAELCDAAHAAGALAIVDACQYVPHNVTDVQAWGADFVAFSSHKMCGPSGIGVLWGRMALLDAMPPFLGGGNMIADVRLDGFTTAPVPAKFEAGTPPIIEAVGLGAAVDFLENLGMADVRRHEMDLTRYAIDTLNERFGDDITIHGPDNVDEPRWTFSASPSAICILTTSARCSTSTTCASAPATTARSRSCGCSASSRPPGRASTSTTEPTTSTPSPMRSTVQPISSDSGAHARPRRPLPRDHPRPLPHPAEPWRTRSPPAIESRGHNPLCGDEIAVYLLVDGEGDDAIVSDVKIAGQGCSITQSSASMMTQAVKGKPVSRGRALVREFKAMMSASRATTPSPATTRCRWATSRRCRASSSSPCGSSAPCSPGTPSPTPSTAPKSDTVGRPAARTATVRRRDGERTA